MPSKVALFLPARPGWQLGLGKCFASRVRRGRGHSEQVTELLPNIACRSVWRIERNIGVSQSLISNTKGTVCKPRSSRRAGVFPGRVPLGPTAWPSPPVSSTGTRLFVTNFSEGKVSIYDDTFAEIEDDEAFVDPEVPAGYAPFGIENINGLIYVTYAKQDRDGEDDVPGPGHGFLAAFDADGNLVTHLASHGPLNSPWGLALAPDRKFGNLTGALLVGNFGDGEIHGYDITTGAFLGTMSKPGGTPLRVDELWALHTIGNAVTSPRASWRKNTASLATSSFIVRAR